MHRGFSLSVALGLGLLAALPAEAADKVTWTFSLFGPPRAATVTFEHLAKVAKEKSGGNFVINLKYNEQLGEAKDFLKGGNIELGGSLPVNTHGGQLGEAYIHGMNGVAEGVRQVRGSAVNQVRNVEHVLVTAGTGVPTSAIVLGKF